MFVLKIVEKDILREILNIGLARAAESFAQIAKGHVQLSIPEVFIVEIDKLYEMVQGYDAANFLVQSDIKGDFTGATMIAFSAEHVQCLTEVCLRQIVPLTLEMHDMQRSLLLEISNILTGAIVTQLANLLKVAIYGAPPTTPGTDLRASLAPLIAANGDDNKPVIFTVITHFQDSQRSIELPLLLFFNRATFEKMLASIREQPSHSKS
jgi:chemotaxis protein CheC